MYFPLLRKQLLSSDLFLKSVAKRWSVFSCAPFMGSLSNDIIKPPPSPLLQVHHTKSQIRPFSTTKPLLSHNFTSHWKNEKFMTIALIGLLPGLVVMDNEYVETLTALLITIHFHAGIQHIQSDYLTPQHIGVPLTRVSEIAVYFISASLLVGLLNLIYLQGGIGKAIVAFWTL